MANIASTSHIFLCFLLLDVETAEKNKETMKIIKKIIILFFAFLLKLQEKFGINVVQYIDQRFGVSTFFYLLFLMLCVILLSLTYYNSFCSYFWTGFCVDILLFLLNFSQQYCCLFFIKVSYKRNQLCCLIFFAEAMTHFFQDSMLKRIYLK